MFGEICWRILFLVFRVHPKNLLDGDFELRSFILRRQEEVQGYTYATKAAGVFADCLVYAVVGAPVHPIQYSLESIKVG